MKESAVEKWLDKNLQSLVDEYSLNHWTIRYRVQEEEEKEFRSAYVCMDYDYLIADITFVSNHIVDMQDLVESARHELEHLLLAPFQILYGQMRDLLSEEAQDIFARLYTTVDEQARANVGLLRKTLLRRRSRRTAK